MRIMKCISPLNVTVMPAGQASIQIGIGWQGDVDQVVARTDRGPETLAQHLGDHIQHFELVNRDGDKPNAKKPAATPAQE